MRTWFITGISRGLGKALAQAALSRGDTVIGTVREHSPFIERAAGQLHVLTLDVANAKGIETAVSQAFAINGRLDVIVNNAGYGLLGAIEDASDADQIAILQTALGERRFDVIFSNAGIWGPLHQSAVETTAEEVQQIMTINAFGPIRLARHLLPRLKEHGTVAFMTSHRASIAGNVEGGLELYRASKAALNMLSRGLYAELKDKGHTVLGLGRNGDGDVKWHRFR